MPEDIKNMFARAYPSRDPWVHKGDFGYVSIVAGSDVHSGSAAFNAIGALRAGADVVVVRGHPRAMNIAAAGVPDIITMPLLGNLDRAAVKDIISDIARFQSLVIGCGLPRTEESFDAIREIVHKCDIPMVLDAEAIRALRGNEELLRSKHAVLTPNSEEFKILTGDDLDHREDVRSEKVRAAARKLGATILLKGHVDVISDGEQVLVNRTGSPYMTKGGFGDVLAGVTGALLARGIAPFEAACLAAYINGRAGEMAAQIYGQSVLASDIFAHLAIVIKEGTIET